MVFPIAGGTQDTGYEISNSCQFNTDAYCEFTPSSGSGSTQFTYSAWVKNCGAGALSETGMILSGAGAGSGADNGIQISAGGSAGKIQFIEYDGGDNAYYIRTNRLFRDPSAWFHLVLIYDAPDSTAGDRMRLYINGTRETSFSHEVQLPQDRAHAGFTRSGVAIRIGSQASGSNQRFDGYLADVYFCDGQNYLPSEFGETNDNGVWIPKKADVSFGTNGFKLEFKQTGTSANSSGIGADTSGNDNHFSVSGLAAENITTDTPTNNFITWNALNHTGASLQEGNTFTETRNSSDYDAGAMGNIGLTRGKWYWELKITAVGSHTYAGIINIGNRFNMADEDYDTSSGGVDGYPVYDYMEEGKRGSNTGSGRSETGVVQATYGDGDILNFALDLDNNKIHYGKNGTYGESSDPANNTNGIAISDGVYYTPVVVGYGNGDIHANFGQPAFSISSGNSDANGYGNFEYAVPSGYYSICTKNLAEYG